MKSVKCLVFDAYGTVFDVHSIVTALDRRFPRQGSEVSKAWRTRQLEYTWLRSLMDRYEDFGPRLYHTVLVENHSLSLRLLSPEFALSPGPAISPHPPQPPAATFKRVYRTRAEHLAQL